MGFANEHDPKDDHDDQCDDDADEKNGPPRNLGGFGGGLFLFQFLFGSGQQGPRVRTRSRAAHEGWDVVVVVFLFLCEPFRARGSSAGTYAHGPGQKK